MVTTLYLVRHGVTVGDEPRRYKGSIDIPLSEEGRQQALKTAAFIRNDAERRILLAEQQGLPPAHVEALYTSPLSRALQTAEEICSVFGIQPSICPEFRERHFGVWEGMTFYEIQKKYPDEFAAWARNPLDHAPVGGETTRQVEERCIQPLKNLVDQHKGNSLIIVAHGGVNRVMLCHIIGLPLEHLFRLEQDNAAVTIIEFWDHYPVLKLLNYSPAKYETLT